MYSAQVSFGLSLNSVFESNINKSVNAVRDNQMLNRCIFQRMHYKMQSIVAPLPNLNLMTKVCQLFHEKQDKLIQQYIFVISC